MNLIAHDSVELHEQCNIFNVFQRFECFVYTIVEYIVDRSFTDPNAFLW